MKKAQNAEEYIARQRAALAGNPDCGNSHYNLAVALIGQKKYEEAEKELLEAVNCSPGLAEAFVHLLPQAADSRFDHVGLGIEMVVPDMLHDHGFGHHSAGIAHEVFKQGVLKGLQIYLGAIPTHLTGQHIDAEIGV